jgi:hypothetical protein
LKRLLLLLLAVGLIACGGINLPDCQKNPCKCLPPGSCTTPTPPAPEVTPTPTPVPTSTVAPTATPAPTAQPTSTATPSPSPEPTNCVPRPGPEPVSLKQAPRCRRGFEPLHFQDDPTLCGLAQGEGDHRTAWRLGNGIFKQGMALVMMRGALVQKQELGCTDALGRWYPGCGDLYSHPEGPTAPYTWGGYPVPLFCEDTPTPTPGPSPTPPPGDTAECARAIAINQHNLVGGGGAHAWHPIDGGLVRVVADTTWRPICDPEHADNWNDPNICGKCSHDPDYDSPAGAQLWTVDGAEDRGPNPGNSAQRIIWGRPGATVRITICPANPVIAAATGTVLPIKGDGCSRPAPWQLPGD